jgi:hypothetical protein
VAPVTASPTGGLPESSLILHEELLGLEGVQALFHTTPMPPLSIRDADVASRWPPNPLSSPIVLVPDVNLAHLYSHVVPAAPQLDQAALLAQQNTATPGPSSRKRRVPEDFENTPTPAKKTRSLADGNQHKAGVQPVTSRVSSMRGRQESGFPAISRSPVRKPPTRTLSPSKADRALRSSMWDESLDDGFGKEVPQTVDKTNNATAPLA